MAKLGFKPQNPGSCVLYIMQYCLLFYVYCIPATDLQLESQPSYCVRSCPQTSTKSFLPSLPKMSSLLPLMPCHSVPNQLSYVGMFYTLIMDRVLLYMLQNTQRRAKNKPYCNNQYAKRIIYGEM